jgi:hypothetical protein
MESKDLKKLFKELAKKDGFEPAFGGWFKESNECIAALYLQKSNYGNYYELNIKIFIQGVFGEHHKKSKELKNAVSDILGRQPEEYRDTFDLDLSIDHTIRKEKLERLFNEFIVPFVTSMLTREGIKKQALLDKDFLPPAVNKELGL